MKAVLYVCLALCVMVLAVSLDSSGFVWISFQIFAGVFLGFLIVLFALPLIPKAVSSLANDPNRRRGDDSDVKEKLDYPPSTFGFFTEVLPGRVKLIERGGRFIRCVMSYEDHAFAGELPNSTLQKESDEYWEVVNIKKMREVDPNVKETHPIPPPSNQLWWPWWIWKRWVYEVTGYAFTGIYPFQMVRVYEIERFEKIKLGDGTEEINRIVDYSDHLRVADFQFPIKILAADTLDKIPVKIFHELMFRVFNPYMAAYQTDDWSARTSAAVSNRTTNYTRVRELDDVLSAKSEGSKNALAEELLKIGDRKFQGEQPHDTITGYGLEMIQALTIDISIKDPKVEERLGDVAQARVDRDAEVIRAEGRAANLKKQIETVKANGVYGYAVLNAEQKVRTAQAAGDKAIVIIGGETPDPLQAAMHRELQKQNEGNAA